MLRNLCYNCCNIFSWYEFSFFSHLSENNSVTDLLTSEYGGSFIVFVEVGRGVKFKLNFNPYFLYDLNLDNS